MNSSPATGWTNVSNGMSSRPATSASTSGSHPLVKTKPCPGFASPGAGMTEQAAFAPNTTAKDASAAYERAAEKTMRSEIPNGDDVVTFAAPLARILPSGRPAPLTPWSSAVTVVPMGQERLSSRTERSEPDTPAYTRSPIRVPPPKFSGGSPKPEPDTWSIADVTLRLNAFE